jgi:hypothetical protein
MGRNPLAGLGESAPFTRATHAVPALKNIDGIDQHGEHKPLLGAQPIPPHAPEELTGQDYIGECERIAVIKLTFRLIGQIVTPFSAGRLGPIPYYRRESRIPRLASGENLKLKVFISSATHCYKCFKM